MSKAPKRRSQPGDIVWHDLVTSDVNGAAEFYGALLGWEYTVWEEGDDLQIQIDGVDYGGILPSEHEESHWLPYLRVENVDELLPRVRAAGGDVRSWSESVAGFGRSAVLVDPEGAVVAAFEPEAGLEWPVGGGLAAEHHVLATNVSEEARFYEIAFRWTPTIVPRPAALTSPLWLTSAPTTDLLRAAARAAELGAVVIESAGVDPTRAIIRDPTGAIFGLVQEG